MTDPTDAPKAPDRPLIRAARAVDRTMRHPKFVPVISIILGGVSLATTIIKAVNDHRNRKHGGGHHHHH